VFADRGQFSLETLLLILIMIAVVAGFVWLRRRIGDEWPLPVPAEQESQPAAETLMDPIAATPSPSLPEALARVVSRPSTIQRPASASQVSTIFHGPVPDQDAFPGAPPVPASLRSDSPAPPLSPPGVKPEPLTGLALRHVTWTLAAGGLLLLSLSQLAARAAPAGQRLPAYLLFLAGGLFFLVGIQTAMRGGLPSRMGQILARLAAFLRVTPGQVVLLALAPGFAFVARQAAGDGILAHQAAVATLAWLLAVALVIAGSVNRHEGEPAQRLDVTRRDVLLSLGLFALALALRASAMTRFPNTYSGDEGSAGLFALELLTGKANNLFGVGWFSFPAFYFTVQSAAIALLGQTIEAVRLTSALAGALTVVALYWLGRAMFDRTTALLAALYLAASHYHIHMSRIALNNVWDALFGTLAIFGLWYGWRSGRRWAFILCGVALGLGQYFYVTIRILPILFLIWAAFAFWRQRAQFRDRFHGLVLAALIALVVYLPLGLYFLANPDEFQAPLNRVTIFGEWLERELARGGGTTAGIILDQAKSGVLGFTHEPLRLLYNPGSALLLTGAGVLFLLGILWAFINFDLRYLLLLLPLPAAVAANAVSQDSPASQRYILAIPLVALFMAVPLAQATAWLRAQYPRAQAAVVAAAFTLMALIALVDVNYYFNRVYDNYVLGGLNTVVATEVANFLRDKEPAGQDVYFFGFPRMGYFSLSTIPFLAPDKNGIDIIEPLTIPPDFLIDGPTLFIFLPERLSELELVRQRYPDGAYEEFYSDKGEFLFAVYQF
jgi:4-amino-4-deoxy-L-arabinose transferase-like glycosyltransferase